MVIVLLIYYVIMLEFYSMYKVWAREPWQQEGLLKKGKQESKHSNTENINLKVTVSEKCYTLNSVWPYPYSTKWNFINVNQ